MARKDEENDMQSAALSRARLERLSRLLRQSGHAQGLNPVQWEALRYLARCNALSHSPGAMARYLGSTKGTVSQTVIALSQKGLVEKRIDSTDARGVQLFLTDAGRKMLSQDVLQHIENDISALSDKTRRRFDRAVTTLLEQERLRQQEPSFGTCLDCRYYREASNGLDAHCMKVGATLAKGEVTLICVEHLGR